MPFVAEPGSDLSEYVGNQFFRVSKTVALKNGRSVTGSIFRGRETNASDEIHILTLLNERFRG